MMETTETTETRPFSVPALIGGLALSLLFGGGLNIISGLMAMSMHEKLLGFGIGAIPGVLFAALAAIVSKRGLAQGLLIGGCIIALIGGACGASLVGTSFK
jgi:hypothetical protein